MNKMQKTTRRATSRPGKKRKPAKRNLNRKVWPYFAAGATVIAATTAASMMFFHRQMPPEMHQGANPKPMATSRTLEMTDSGWQKEAERMQTYYWTVSSLKNEKMNNEAYNIYFLQLARKGWTREKLKSLFDRVGPEFENFVKGLRHEYRNKYGNRLYYSLGISTIEDDTHTDAAGIEFNPMGEKLSISLILNPNALDTASEYLDNLDWVLAHEKRHARHGLALGAAEIQIPPGTSIKAGHKMINKALALRLPHSENVAEKLKTGDFFLGMDEIYVGFSSRNKSEAELMARKLAEFSWKLGKGGLKPDMNVTPDEEIRGIMFLMVEITQCKYLPELAEKTGVTLPERQAQAIQELENKLDASLVNYSRLDMRADLQELDALRQAFYSTAREALDR